MKVKTINTSEVNENSVKVVSIDDKDIAIFNVEGEYFAIDDMCSHAEASLAEGEVFDCKIECLYHRYLQLLQNFHLPLMYLWF